MELPCELRKRLRIEKNWLGYSMHAIPFPVYGSSRYGCNWGCLCKCLLFLFLSSSLSFYCFLFLFISLSIFYVVLAKLVGFLYVVVT